MENYRLSIVELIDKYEKSIHDAEHDIKTVDEKKFIDEDEKSIYIFRKKNEFDTMKECLEKFKNDLIEIDDLIKNPPPVEEEVEEKVIHKTFEEELQELINLRSNDSWKLFIDDVVDCIDDTHRRTIKSVIKEYRSGFDKALNELKAFVNRLITKERTRGINKSLVNNRFNHFDQYLNKVVYNAAMTADPPENDGNSESVKVCCREIMKNFNEMVKINEFIDQETKDLEEDGIHVPKVTNWIDTIGNDEWFFLNDLVESYNDFYHTAISSKEFGKIMKGKFDSKRKTINKVKYTFYYKK